MFASDSARWHAVKTRDHTAHYSFYYGVTSTKIYCRPTCNARLARRANVCYFDDISTARTAGFRACNRCKPDDPTFKGQRDEIVGRTLSLLKNNDGNELLKNGVSGLAKKVGVSTSYLCRAFKKRMGMSVGTYLTEFERGPNDYDGSPIVPSTGYVAPPAVQFTSPLSQTNVTASECSPMSRSSSSSSTTRTNPSLTNTANTTPSATEAGSPPENQAAILCDSDASTQGLLYDTSLTGEAIPNPTLVLSDITHDYRHEMIVVDFTIPPIVNADPLATDFDLNDPIWNQCVAPRPTTPG